MKPFIVLIANPTAKSASMRKIQEAVGLLRAAGHEVNLFLTAKRGDAEVFARKAAEEGASLVVAAGGDGTFNEVINGIAGADAELAIIPMGTTNVLAKELAVPENVPGAVSRILGGKAHKVSLGRITFMHDGARMSRYFCLMAGIGFDADAVFRKSERIKRYSGKGAYILSGLQSLARHSPGKLSFLVDGRKLSGYAAIICNASRYGGNFKAAPDARLLSPHLYAFIMNGKRRTDILRYALGIMRGTHTKLRDVTYMKADSIEVAGEARIQVDGDYVGITPAEIAAAPKALKLIY